MEISRILLGKAILFSLSSFVIFSCNKDDDPGEKITYTITANATGAQEVPSVTTDGHGTVNGTYNKNTNVLDYTATWHELSGPAINMHFHGPAAVGEPAGVAIPIPGFAATAEGSLTRKDTLTEAQEADMLGGLWYYNVHTDLNKGGEIRGQVSAN
jgi:hypothetical protein